MANPGGRTVTAYVYARSIAEIADSKLDQSVDVHLFLYVKWFFAKLRKTSFSVVTSARPSARMEQLGPTGRTFMKNYV
jgi:hypothetical protein